MTKNTPQISLALGSGGWRGLAHVGVIKSLTRHGFQISSIAGSSAGALIGGLYALSLDIDRIESQFISLKHKDVLSAFSDPSTKRGLFQGKKTLSFIEKLSDKATFADTLIPFRAVATNIMTGKAVVFSEGSLAFAIRTSSSVPIIYDPVVYRNQLLVDGAVVNPIPVSTARKLPGDIVIAVNLYNTLTPIKKSQKKVSKFDLGITSIQLMMNQLAQRDGGQADLLVEPLLPLQIDPLYRIENNMAAIKCGENAMDEQIPKLKRLLSSL